jgi:NAD(P)-dependent dehydrogenase (short-subunit alcohol dehydrogenase family)
VDSLLRLNINDSFYSGTKYVEPFGSSIKSNLRSKFCHPRDRNDILTPHTQIATREAIIATMSDDTLRNPVALLTGGNTGIGLVACQQLAAQGIDVIFTCRSATKGEEAVAVIQKYAVDGVKIRFIIMDLSDLSSVAKGCDELLNDEGSRLDYLILNAGVMGNPMATQLEKSTDEIEFIVAVNHVAGYYITHKLLPLMEATAKKSPLPEVRPMITFVSSD